MIAGPSSTPSSFLPPPREKGRSWEKRKKRKRKGGLFSFKVSSSSSDVFRPPSLDCWFWPCLARRRRRRRRRRKEACHTTTQGCRMDKVKISPELLENFAKFRQVQKCGFMPFLLPNILEISQNKVSKILFIYNGFFPVYYIKMQKNLIFFKFRQNFAKFRNFAKAFKISPRLATAFQISPFFVIWRKFRQSGNAATTAHSFLPKRSFG